MKHQTTELSG